MEFRAVSSSKNEEISTVKLEQAILPMRSDIGALIEDSRKNALRSVNAEITLLYWKVGQRINQEVLQNARAAYGKQIVAELSASLTATYGKGWSEKQLFHCLRLVTVFPDENILSAVRRELNWTQLKSLIYMDDPLKREFYIEMSKLEGWSSRQLQGRIRSMLYERTAISKKPEDTIRQELTQLKQAKTVSHDLVFRDPYLLDFLGLHDTYLEKDLESAILAELQQFIIELGNDFAFMARQKRIEVDHRDYYIDLLFYHRRLKCLVAIDLKIGEFEAANKGQMELYLNYLEKYERVDGENPPIGLILCTGKNAEHVELMQLDKSNIRVADYLTVLPSNEVLKEKLHQAVKLVQEKEQTSLEHELPAKALESDDE